MVGLTREPIDANELISRVSRDNCGAVNVFLGTVRSVTGEQVTAALEYEAYPEMAERMMARVETEARARWPVGDIIIVHRLGRLTVGEASVGVAVSCPHRADSFDACRFVIDRLKEDVPIWKREIAPNGEAAWVHPGVTT